MSTVEEDRMPSSWPGPSDDQEDPDTPGRPVDSPSSPSSPSISLPPASASSTLNGPRGDAAGASPPQDQDSPVEYSNSHARSRPVGLPDLPPPPTPEDLAVSHRGEKQIKPNKVYIGGLPEHTRQDDLRNCFSKIGKIAGIELKAGYGFVEFESREAAELSVSKYHEGYFMGNKIRVELSKGGGRTAKYSGDPGACFKCGQMGHWARECPHADSHPNQQRRHEPPLPNRVQRDYTPAAAAPPPPPPRDSRYEYPPRDYRRPPSPRDYYPPPANRGRHDDYRYNDRDRERERDRDQHHRYPPPPPDYRGRYAEPAPPPSYRGPPPASYSSDRYRSGDRYGYPPPPPSGRARTPPRYRDDYPPPRNDYDYRGRPMTPPRYAPDYPAYRSVTPNPYSAYDKRQRSASPPPRSAGYDYNSGPPTGGYPSTPPGPPPPRSSRDYPPPSRSGGGRDVPPDSYRRA
ncbi:RNA-binding domain-containing protein [Dendrothele bispora CBS 962.96]|uniref:RNA-binding domain-containing protein n=1 Tax=Dendrothele bispora (strain CBS 962.96) TaxID=1314807 RepID=A0A4S8LHA9_DENBC|nr:RNA-binding domain-containing protein [Dendrothele bispora CBS 962.96]